MSVTCRQPLPAGHTRTLRGSKSDSGEVIRKQPLWVLIFVCTLVVALHMSRLGFRCCPGLGFPVTTCGGDARFHRLGFMVDAVKRGIV